MCQITETKKIALAQTFLPYAEDDDELAQISYDNFLLIFNFLFYKKRYLECEKEFRMQKGNLFH